MTKNFNLNSVAMLVEFNASVWTARKLDKAKSDEVVSGAGAKSKGAARVNKNLLAGRPELAEIAAIVGDARTYVYDNTTPWSDNGQRLLVTARLPKFDARMDYFRGLFDEKVNAFVALYPTLITAQAMALGSMFNRSEFPQASEIASKFGFSCEYVPVPSSGDIRVDVGNQALDELRERLEFSHKRKLDKVQADVTARFTEHLKRMSERLLTDTDPKTGEQKARRFTETLVSSAFELCDLANDYNVTGDPVLAEARKTLETVLTGVTPVTLREDPDKRDEVQKAATSLLNKFSFSL